MSGGRTSLLYANLVQAGRALSAQAVSAYPADRHPNVFFAYAVPTRDGSLPALARAVREQALRVADGSAVDARALERVKKVCLCGVGSVPMYRRCTDGAQGNRVDLLNVLRSNSSMVSVLCAYTAMRGSWRGVVEELQLVEDMQAGTLKATAQEVFRADNQYIGYVDKL